MEHPHTNPGPEYGTYTASSGIWASAEKRDRVGQGEQGAVEVIDRLGDWVRSFGTNSVPIYDIPESSVSIVVAHQTWYASFLLAICACWFYILGSGQHRTVITKVLKVTTFDVYADCLIWSRGFTGKRDTRIRCSRSTYINLTDTCYEQTPVVLSLARITAVFRNGHVLPSQAPRIALYHNPKFPRQHLGGKLAGELWHNPCRRHEHRDCSR